MNNTTAPTATIRRELAANIRSWISSATIVDSTPDHVAYDYAEGIDFFIKKYFDEERDRIQSITETVKGLVIITVKPYGPRIATITRRGDVVILPAFS